MITPAISIITPTFNREKFILEAVKSVQMQDVPADILEHIIMDGGSTDNTLGVLKEILSLRVYSEKDKGLYDAINKGIILARGDIIGHLNSDDLYEPGILKAVKRAFDEHPEMDGLCGKALVFRSGAPIQYFEAVQPAELLARATLGTPIINAWFFRKRFYEKHGMYDLRYPMAADRDLLIRLALADVKYLPIDLAVYRYRHHEGSLTINDHRKPWMRNLQDEFLNMSEYYLSAYPDDPGLTRLFRRWHDVAGLEKVIATARVQDWSGAASAIRQARSVNRLWFFYALRVMPGKIMFSLKRRLNQR